MDTKYTLLKSDNLDLKIENKMYTKENSRLNKIIIAQKQVKMLQYVLIIILLLMCILYNSIYLMSNV